MFDMTPGRRKAAVLPAVVLALSSCGAPAELTPDDRTVPTAPTASEQTLHATAREFAFEPDAWRASPGQPTTIRLTNEGATVHEWVLMRTPIAAEMEFHEDLVLFEVEAAAGETVRGDFDAPTAGDYQVICAVPGHFTAGMRATLSVR